MLIRRFSAILLSLLAVVAPSWAFEVTSPKGTLLVQKQGHGFAAVPPGTSITSGETIVCLPGGYAVLANEGKLRMTLVGDLPPASRGLIFDTSLTAKDIKNLDFVIHHGRVVIENQSTKSTPVQLGVQGQPHVKIKLRGKGAKVALELVRRWPRGTTFTKKQVEGREPTSLALLFVIAGSAEIESKNVAFGVRAPAVMRWSGSSGLGVPVRLEESPEWTKAKTKVAAAAKALQLLLAKQSVASALTQAMQARDVAERKLAVHLAGAVDRPGLVVEALSNQKSAAVRSAAARQLRHWMGTSRTHEQRVYKALSKKHTAGTANILMHLLHGFSTRSLTLPETYETLIDYLGNGNLAVRELSRDNLYALVPSGKSIDYDAAAGPEQRAKAQAAWRKLIPAGKLPPRSTSQSE